jgi:hypothetical protein
MGQYVRVVNIVEFELPPILLVLHRLILMAKKGWICRFIPHKPLQKSYYSMAECENNIVR